MPCGKFGGGGGGVLGDTWEIGSLGALEGPTKLNSRFALGRQFHGVESKEVIHVKLGGE